MKSLDHTFAAESEKQHLSKVWKEWEHKNTGLMNSAEKNSQNVT